MSKSIIVILAITCISLVSCKKEYTCDCTTTVNIPGFGTTSSNSSTTFKDSKKNAESGCDEVETKLKNEVGASGTATCTLNKK